MGMYEESLRHFLKPIGEFLDDPKVSEIMINGPEEIWIEKGGNLTLTQAKFTNEGLEAAARNMAQFVGRILDDERPRLDARLPDGSRIHIVMPPIARKGCTIAIRKFFPDKLTVANLVQFGSMSPAMANFIDACVQLKENVIVSGGTGSGKTTMLNCVAAYIHDEERIITIEDSAELQMNQEHLVPFESRPPDKFGKGKVDMGDLLQSSLRLRPDRIVVGEVRGGEAFHLMQAMNTGHGGSLATVHANTPTDTLRRLESLCLQSGIDLPMVAVRAQVASAINITLCCARLSDGSRRTTHISEVLPLNEKGDYRTQDIFVFTQTHKDADGKIHGYHSPTGLIPTFFEQLKAFGFGYMDEEFFDPATYGQVPPPSFVGAGFKPRWSPSLKHREEGLPDPEHNPVADALREKGKTREIIVRTGMEGKEPPKPMAPPKAEATDLGDDADAAPAAATPPPPEDEYDEPSTRIGAAPAAVKAQARGDELGAAVPATAEKEESTDPGADDAPVGLSDEEAAIAAALAAAEAAEQPSIQLADDFAEEAKAYEDQSSNGPEGRPRRRRGGTIGRK
ncbi:MAG: CpaF family protein [Deltaproteobacteria bacterium]|nr:CpaF family protein [Deltaproteobacteria bacterium]